MIFRKEIYREFEKKLFVYRGAFDVPDTPEINKTREKKEGSDKEVPTTQEIIIRIKEHKDNVHEHIKALETKMNNRDLSSVKGFVDQIRSEVDSDFDALNQKYLEEANRIGKAIWEGSNEERAIFRQAEDLEEKFRQKLEAKEVVKKAVTEYLERIPNLEAKTEEKELIKEWIAQDPKLSNYYGKDEYLDQVTELIARKYDIQFKVVDVYDSESEETVSQEEAVYGINIEQKKVYPAESLNNEKSLKEVILAELEPGENYSPEKIRKTERKFNRFEKHVLRIQNEIKNGSIFALGGEIDQWKDWFEHRGLSELDDLTGGIEPQAKKALQDFEATQIKKEALAKNLKELEKYKAILEASGLKEKFDQAEAKGWTHLTDLSDRIDPLNGDLKSSESLQSPDGNITITTKIENGEKIVLLIESQNPAFKTEQGFSNADEFKGIALIEFANQQIENFNRNKKNTEELQEQVKEIDRLGILDGQINTYDNEELARNDFKVSPIEYSMNGYKVAQLTVDYSGEKLSYTLRLANGNEVSDDNIKSLAAQIKGLQKEIEGIAQKAEQTKVEIEQQVETDLSTLTPVEGFKIVPQKPTGDFADPQGKILVAEIQGSDGTPLGEIYMPISFVDPETGAIQEIKGEKTYELEIDGKREQFSFASEIPEYLEKNKAELLTKKPEAQTNSPDLNFEFTGDEEMIKLKKEVKAKMLSEFKDSYQKNSSFKDIFSGLEGQLLDNNPDQSLDLMVECLPQAALKRIVESKNIAEFSMTPEEQKEFLNNVLKKLQEKNINLSDQQGAKSNSDQDKQGDAKESAPGNTNDRNSKNKPEGKLNISTFGDLASWASAFKDILDMWASGDMGSIQEIWNSLKVPGGYEGLKKRADETYSKALEKANLEQLIAIHSNPTGDVATQFLEKLGGGEKDTPLRNRFKLAARKSIQDIIKTDITEWKGDTIIFSKAGKEHKLYLLPGQSNNDTIRMVVGGTTQTFDVSEGLKGTGQTWEGAIAQLNANPLRQDNPAVTPTTNPVPPETPATQNPGSKKPKKRFDTIPSNSPANPSTKPETPPKPTETPTSASPEPVSSKVGNTTLAEAWTGKE